MNFDSKAYAERIKDLRTRRGLTQAQFAEEIGISTNYLAKIENNRQSGKWCHLNYLFTFLFMVFIFMMDLA